MQGEISKFPTLFKKYRLKAGFATLSSLGMVLADKGLIYEDSIFSHWQKGDRLPNRGALLKLLEIFAQRHSIRSLNEANEFLASTGEGYLTREEANELLAATGFGYLTKQEEEKLDLKIKSFSKTQISRNSLLTGVFIIFLFLLGFLFIYLYIHSHLQQNYVNSPYTVPSAVTEPKKLVIGIDATLEPMEYIENGQLVGFDVDLGTNLAKELDADIEFRNIIFDNLFNSLDQRQINMIISAVTITLERQQKYDFSDEYLKAGQVIITQKGNTTIHGVTDLKGKKIATQTGTTNEKESLKYTYDRFVIRYPDFIQATKALVDGNVDALFTDFPNAKGIISKNSGLKIVSDPFTEEYYSIVFRKGDPSVTQINEALTSLRKRGTLADLEKKWLN